ncbi:MAG: YidC/Oxa1 family insertase periplasmic-domain containing protein [Pirellulaceae bacterium]|nr:YidC/Oxa1 family insertase periplasmic-domain containing protein [Pirellulaceae bacterium]
MDRRFLLFLVLVGLVWGSFLGLRMFFGPEPVEPDQPVAEAPVDPAEVPPAEAPADDPAKPPTDPAATPPAAAPADPSEKPKPPSAAVKRLVLGSLDEAGPYRMLVTFTSQGAAVERVELSKFQDIEDLSGYLGHLQLTDGDKGGAVVGLVGAGTPAALAKCSDATGVGLLAGDCITAVNGAKIDDAEMLVGWLKAESHPGQTIELKIERPGVAKSLAYSASLTRRPLEVVRPESHTYDNDGVTEFLPQDPLSLLATLDTIGGKSLKAGQSEFPGLPSLLTGNWTIDDQGPDFVQFSYTLDEAALKAAGRTGAFKIVKKFTLAKDGDDKLPGYHLKLRMEVHNLATEPQSVAYRLQGPTGLPLEGWWYSTKLHPEWFKAAGARDVAWRVPGRRHELMACPEIVSESKAKIAKKLPPLIELLDGDADQPIDYAGVDTQFFASALIPQETAADKKLLFRRAEALAVQDVEKVPKNRLKTTNVSVQLVSQSVQVAPDKPLKHDYIVFFGPKDKPVLEAYDLADFIEYGWLIFKVTALFLQWVLGQLYWVTTNYGVSIILLTLIVRSCMVPVSLKQAKSAAMMQMLAPEMAKIKEKFPDDAMKQNAAMQELYKKHNFNPFGGCLLVFIQLPIFMGLYRCLSVDIHLRDAALIPGLAWASNLAGPDKLFNWEPYVWAIIGDPAAGWFGPFFNILPLFTVALFLVQQKMFTPPATDEQTRMQQQMMTYMTVFMGVMFYKVPAGLCLYFITSSLWGICERKLLPKPKSPGSDTLVAAVPKSSSPNGSSKPAGSRPAGKKQKRR